MTEAFPYTTSYPQSREMFTLTSTCIKPRKVLFSRLVDRAEALATDTGAARVHASYGVAEVMLDFEQEVVGSFHLVAVLSADASIVCSYGETQEETLDTHPYKGGWYVHPRDAFVLLEGRQAVESRGRRAFRFVHLRISCEQDLLLESVFVMHRTYPTSQRGSFSSSDLLLNQIWLMSQRTTQLCMQQFYEDGVKRDGLLWIGDYRVQYLCNVALFADSTLARKSLLMIAASQRADGALPACAGKGGGHQHPDGIDYMPGIPGSFVDTWIILNYGIDYLCCVREYVMHSGDGSIVSDLWPCLCRLLRYLTQAIDRSNPAYFFTDSHVALPGNTLRSLCCLLMQWYEGLGDALALAQMMDDQEVIALCTTQRADLRAHIEGTFFDTEHGIFRDQPHGGVLPQSLSWHAQAFAVLSGLRTEWDAAQQLLRNIDAETSAIPPVSGQMKFWVIKALLTAGMTDRALGWIKYSWGMMLKEGSTTCWEVLNEQKLYLDDIEAPISYCHGWSAGPSYLLPAYILGIRPTEIGYTKIEIQPQVGSLQWVEGIFPTPHGDIYVHWETEPSLHGWLELPVGVVAVVKLIEGNEPIDLHAGRYALSSQMNTIMVQKLPDAHVERFGSLLQQRSVG